MTTFAPPVIPASALRRSWLYERMADVRAGLELRRELARLNRTAAAACDYRDPRACLGELYREAARRFPVAETYETEILFANQSDLDDPEDWRQVLYYGIPVEIEGYHPDRGDKVCDLVCLDINQYFSQPSDLTHFGWTHPEADALARWWPGKMAEAQRLHAGKPTGRKFTGVWCGLPDLVDYVRAETMNGWLDVNGDDVAEMEMPRWTADEIRSMETGWKKAKPVLARIEALTKYIAASLPKRLPLLDKALRGDPQTLAAISRPVRSKTLVDIFGKDAK